MFDFLFLPAREKAIDEACENLKSFKNEVRNKRLLERRNNWTGRYWHVAANIIVSWIAGGIQELVGISKSLGLQEAFFKN